MKNKIHLIYISIILGIILLSYFFFYKPLSEYDKYDIEITKKEERIKYLEQEVIKKDSLYNIVLFQRDSIKKNIDNRKETIKYITEKYDKEIIDISNLSNDSTISYFTNWINK